MILRRLSLFILLLWWMAPSPAHRQPARPRANSASFQRLAVAQRRTPHITSGTRISSVKSFSPWRYRLKSVLPDSDSRQIPETDVGPVPAVERPIFSPAQNPGPDPLRAVVPLRC